jgi:hypothetical protein
MQTQKTMPDHELAILAYYVSRDRVLSLLNPSTLPRGLRASLNGQDVPMASAILSNSLGEYLFPKLGQIDCETIQQLALSEKLQPGVSFLYNGHFYGKGFGVANKTPALSLSENLDEPLKGKTLVLNFSKNGLVNDTAYSRLSRSTRLFAYAYVTEIDDKTIHAVPFIIGDLIFRAKGSLPLSVDHTLALRPNYVDQFASMDMSWLPSTEEFGRLKEFSEQVVKQMFCDLLGEIEIPHDWPGEESDIFSANLSINGLRHTAAFLLKGPARFHPMTPADCGKRGDQIYRLFNIPADVYIIQHCHKIGPAIRKTVEAFALQRTFNSPCQYMLLDGSDTARLLRVRGLW